MTTLSDYAAATHSPVPLISYTDKPVESNKTQRERDRDRLDHVRNVLATTLTKARAAHAEAIMLRAALTQGDASQACMNIVARTASVLSTLDGCAMLAERIDGAIEALDNHGCA